MMENIQDLYRSDKDFAKYVDHWAQKEGKDINEVLTYEITRLYAKQILEKEEETYENLKIGQDNGI